jgi:hypothetical protein
MKVRKSNDRVGIMIRGTTGTTFYRKARASASCSRQLFARSRRHGKDSRLATVAVLKQGRLPCLI